MFGEDKAAPSNAGSRRKAMRIIEYFKQLPEPSEHSKEKQFPTTAPLKYSATSDSASSPPQMLISLQPCCQDRGKLLGGASVVF